MHSVQLKSILVRDKMNAVIQSKEREFRVKHLHVVIRIHIKHTLRVEHSCLIWLSLALTYSIKASPATASIRLIPDAIPCSDIILNPRISDVLLTWVPPQSSMDTPGTSTTRTYRYQNAEMNEQR